MSISDQITRLNNAKAAIKQAISNKGVEVSDEAKLDEYPALIDSIEVGGGGGSDDFLAIRTNNGVDMSHLFYCYKGTELDVSNLDTSNATIMYFMFSNSIFLTELNLSTFDTSDVTDMRSMFNGSNKLTTLDLSNFDMTNVTGTDYMFYTCNSLHTLRLNNCSNDTINKIITSSNFPTGTIDGVTRKIYVNPDNLGYLEAPENWIFVDLDGNEIEIREPEIYQVGYYRDKSDITEATTMVNNTHTDLNDMFYGCTNLTTINNIEQWDTSNVTNMRSMFRDCNNLTSLDLSNFDTGNVTNMGDMFCFCKALTELDLSNFDTSNVENMWGMFWGCSSLEVLNISNFDTSSVTSIGDTFDCPNLHTLRLDNCSNNTIRTLVTSQNFPTNAIDGGKRSIYCKAENTAGLYAIENWIFIDCITGEEIVLEQPPGEKPPGEKPASPYEEGQFAKNTDITVANTLVTKEHDYLNSMFSNCTNLAVVDTSDWDTGNVKNMGYMFYNCENLPYLDLSSFDTSNVESMIDMFYGCTDLLYLDISNFTVGEFCSLGKDYNSGMFWDCTSLLDLRLDNCYPDTIDRIINSHGFQVNPGNKIEDLPRVVYVREENEYHLTLSDGSVFGYIEDPVYITNKDLAKWDYINDREVANVIVDTQADFDRYENNSLDRLFENCSNLRLINGIEQWNTTGIKNMSYMFNRCTHLVSLNLSSFDISNVRDINNMFDGCTNLRYLDISNFIMGEEYFNYNTSEMFRDCNNLRHLRLDNCDRNTIEKIIRDSNLPTGKIDGETRKMYVQEANITNEWGDKLTAPDDWEFIYLVEAKKEEE